MKIFPAFVSLTALLLAAPAGAATLRTIAPGPTVVAPPAPSVVTSPTSSVQRVIQPVVQPVVLPATEPTHAPVVETTVQPALPVETEVTAPAPVSAEKIRQRQMLNPQPEPPMPAIKNLLLTKPEIKNADGSSEITIPNSLKTNSGEIKLLVKPEVTTEGNQTFLRSRGIQVALKSVPTAVYQKLSNVFEKNNIKMLSKLTLDVENGKPMYSVQTEQPAKLLGFIPIKLKSIIKIDENGVAAQTGLPWYASLSKQAVNAVDKLSKLPNLVLKNVRFEPAAFSDGEAVNAYLTVENQGLGYAVSIPDFVGNTCAGEEVYYNDSTTPGRWYCEIIALAPGESYDYVFPLTGYCPSKAKFVFANSSEKIEETTKDDNSLTMDLKCK